MNINATIFGQAIAFVIFVWFCMRYVWPPIVAAIENRQKAIADGLQNAEQAKKDLKLAQAQSSDQLRNAKQEAAVIIEKANKYRIQIIDEAKQEANAERKKIISQGQAEIEVERIRLCEELRSQIAVLAIQAAEKIIHRSIDSEANQNIFDKILAEL